MAIVRVHEHQNVRVHCLNCVTDGRTLSGAIVGEDRDAVRARDGAGIIG